jgi:hypothetical protein
MPRCLDFYVPAGCRKGKEGLQHLRSRVIQRSKQTIFTIEITLSNLFSCDGWFMSRRVVVFFLLWWWWWCGDGRLVVSSRRRGGGFKKYVLWREALSRPRYAPVKDMGHKSQI